jgi:hypothetical protein
VSSGTVTRVQGLDAYLARMGVSDTSLRQLLVGEQSGECPSQLPLENTDRQFITCLPSDILAALESELTGMVTPANVAAMMMMEQVTWRHSQQAPPMFIVVDPARGNAELDAWLATCHSSTKDGSAAACAQQPCFYLTPPRNRQLCDRLATVQQMAGAILAALCAKLPASPCVVAGHGLGVILAHELACQMCQSGGMTSNRAVVAFVMLQDRGLHSAYHMACQPWAQCWPWLTRWRPDLCLPGISSNAAALGRRLALQGLQSDQLDLISSLCPTDYPKSMWLADMEEQVRSANARMQPSLKEFGGSFSGIDDCCAPYLPVLPFAMSIDSTGSINETHMTTPAPARQAVDQQSRQGISDDGGSHGRLMSVYTWACLHALLIRDSEDQGTALGLPYFVLSCSGLEHE